DEIQRIFQVAALAERINANIISVSHEARGVVMSDTLEKMQNFVPNLEKNLQATAQTLAALQALLTPAELAEFQTLRKGIQDL
ncbi:hypothetical protein ACJEM9_24890, partial [Escherichia coli]